MTQTTQAAAQALQTGPVAVRLCNETAFPGGALGQEQVESLRYAACCCDSDVGLGGVYSAQLSGVLHGAWDLLGAELLAQMGAQVQGEQQWMNLGRFVVDECSRGDDDTRFTAHDAVFWAAGGSYVPTVSSGAALSEVLLDVADQCGLDVETTTVNLGLNLTVTGELTGHSCREMLGWLAGLCGRNCVVSREGALRFVWFSDSGQSLSAQDYYDGGLSSGGGSVLSGIVCTVPGQYGAEDSQLTAGNAACAIAMENPFMTAARLAALWQDLGGWEYQVGEVSLWGGALLEPGDVVELTNRAGERVALPVMQTLLELDGGCRCTLSSWGKGTVCRQSAGVTPVRQLVERARESARQAAVSANGKNRVFYRASAPSASEWLTSGDLWFNTAMGNRASVWDGTQWVLKPFGYQAVESLDAGAITTGTLSAARIGAGSITADKLDVEDLFSQNITVTGSLQIENEDYSLLVNNEWMGMTFYAFDEEAHTGCQLMMRQAGQADLYGSSGLSLRSNGDVSIQAGSSGPVQIYGQECILHGNVSVVQNGNLYPGNLSVSGDVNASGRLAASGGIIEGGTALEDRYSKKLTVDSVTIPLSAQAGKAQETSRSVVKSGKTALAVAGYRLSGSYATFQNVYELYVSNNVCYCGIRNTSSTDFSGSVIVTILYVSN